MIPQRSEAAVKQAVLDNAHSYRSPAEMLEHVELLAKLTRGKSGCFGVTFPQLLPVVRKLAASSARAPAPFTNCWPS